MQTLKIKRILAAHKINDVFDHPLIKVKSYPNIRYSCYHFFFHFEKAYVVIPSQ